MAIGLNELNHQLAVLKEDQKKTQEKMLQIMGAMKIIEFFISELKDEADKEKVNGAS